MYVQSLKIFVVLSFGKLKLYDSQELVMGLNYNPELCLSCESIDCLMRCQHIEIDFDNAREEIKKIASGDYSRILELCINCYACEEYCPYGNHVFYRIVELQEKYDVFKRKEFLREIIERYKAEGEFKPKRVGKRVIHLCLFPDFVKTIKGKLFEGLDIVRGRHLFCNLVYLHFGNVSTVLERAKRVIKNMVSLGIDEAILFHDECYAFYNSFAKAYGFEVPFKTTHIFEYLLSKLKELRDEVKQLDIRVAYQRPCSNRLIPETDKILDELFKLIGVERIERKYDRENALCCGSVFKMQGDLKRFEDLQRKNLEDILNSKATHVVFNCPMCYTTMKDAVKAKGLTPIMISELCKMAIGEETIDV